VVLGLGPVFASSSLLDSFKTRPPRRS